MKNIILFASILVISVGNIFAQEVANSTAVIQSQQKSEKTSGYRSHSIGITQRFGGAFTMASGLGVDYNQAMSLTTLDFYIKKRSGRSQYTPFIQIRFSMPMGGRSYTKNEYGSSLLSLAEADYYVDSLGPFMGRFGLGILFGGSQYLFDKRSKETGKGWSMMINGGMVISIYAFKGIEYLMMLKTPLGVGVELGFKPIYNFSKNIALTFGFDIGYELSSSQSNNKDFSMSDLLQHAVTYGFSIGVLF